MKIKKLTIFSLVVFMLMSLILTSCGGTEEVNFTADNYLQGQMPKKGDEIAIIKTNMGEMKVMLFPKYAPKAVENFTTLAKEGKYDGIIFHRVVNDFMIQTGITNDGTVSKWGSSFEIETTDMLHHFKGALSMANTGRANSNSSQFFIVQRGPVSDQYIQYFQNNNYINNDEVAKVYKSVGGTPDLDGGITGLNAGYTVFGHVFEGLDVVDAIAGVDLVYSEMYGDTVLPAEDVIIETIEITTYEG